MTSSAQARAIDFLTTRYRESLDLEPAAHLPLLRYGLNENEWDVFFVGRKLPVAVELGPAALRLVYSAPASMWQSTGSLAK